MDQRIHIFGASGAGTTTLGSLLSRRLGVPHLDTDDYFWAESAIPFTEKRAVGERTEMLRADLERLPGWVLSGSLCGWGDFAIPLFALAVFLWIPQEARIRRLRSREVARYGTEALLPGGWFHENSEAFIAWASAYDSAGLEMRSRALHEQWINELPCKVLRFQESCSVEELASRIENQMDIK